MHTYSFEKLSVWQDARELVKFIYSLTTNFPAEEKFGVISQVRRSSVSVSCNIAEGSCRKSKKDQARFYEIAFGSAIETLNLLLVSNDLQFITEEQMNKGRELVEKISNKLNKLISSILSINDKQINA